MTRSAYDVIVRPLQTEKSTKSKEKLNSYVFEVALDSDKGEIKRAVEEIFPKIKVARVRTIVMKGKPKRARMHIVHKASWKKAVVTLKEGQRIESI